MTREQFIELLAKGEYEIKMEKECACSFNWEIKGGELIPNIDPDMCWVGKILYMYDATTGRQEPIIQNVAYEALEELDLPDMSDIDLQEIIEEYDLDMFFNENTEENDEHDRRQYESLVEWLEESDYDFYIDPRRGFENEYDCVLASKDADVDEDYESVTAEDWAERYLEKNNAATKYYIGFELID